MNRAQLLSVIALGMFGYCLLSTPALAQSAKVHASDPIAPVILGAAGILFFALLGRFASRSLGQPPVVGELLMGVALGNLAIYFNYDLMIVLREGPALFDTIDLSFHGHPLKEAAELSFAPNGKSAALEILRGPDGAEVLQVAHIVDIFARFGALLLLFYVGLGSSLEELREVGAESLGVAISGVVMPFVLGFVVMWLLLPELPPNAKLFVAATLSATSVGITASVLQELNRQNSHEARVILGAAVIDDILGLILLAIVAGLVVSGSVVFMDVLGVVLRAVLFLIAVIFLGPLLLRAYIFCAGRLPLVEAKLFVSVIFAMGMAWVADLAGLAPIIGAFAAGVVLSDGYFRHWKKSERRSYRIRDLIMPMELILVPFFFVLMGIQVKLESFLDWQVAKLSLALLVAAVIGKLAAGLFAHKGTKRWAVGLGMLPRGEVGLVFAAIGKSLSVISDALFSAIVLMVMVTTLAAPLLLRRALRNVT